MFRNAPDHQGHLAFPSAPISVVRIDIVQNRASDESDHIRRCWPLAPRPCTLSDLSSRPCSESEPSSCASFSEDERLPPSEEMSHSCAVFWGPTAPMFGGHTVDELGASHYLPASALFAYRAVATLFYFGAGVYMVAVSPIVLASIAFWAWTVSAFSFALRAFCALVASEKPYPGFPDLQPGLLQQVAGPLHQTAASLALYAFAVFVVSGKISSVFITPSIGFLYFANLALVLFDFVLGSRQHFRTAVLWIPSLFVFVYYVFLLVWWTQRRFDFESAPNIPVVLIAYQFLILLCSLTMHSVSRINGALFTDREDCGWEDDGEV